MMSLISDARGYSLAEMLVVIALVGLGLAIAMPSLMDAADAADASAAARYLSGLVARARIDAARRQATVALRFDPGLDDPAFSVVVDGDGDGVGAADVASGVDWVTRPPDRLSWHFPRARFGIAAAVDGIDGSRGLSPTDDPIQVGAARQLSVTPFGTATSGTLYVSSRRGVQFAVRVAGVTGRARVLRFVPGQGTWKPF